MIEACLSSGGFLFPGREFETYPSVIFQDQVCIEGAFGPFGNKTLDQTGLLFGNEFLEFLQQDFLIK